MKNNTVLITGGAGYIGSHMNKYLSDLGIKTVVFDNLSKGHKELVKWGEFVQGDLLNLSDLENVFSQYKIGSVIHFAALSSVEESVKTPKVYYENNIKGSKNLLDSMVKHRVKNIVFSSTAAVYGEPESIPIKESDIKDPINPYGHTKLAIEWMLNDYTKAYDINYSALRYFNAAGADPDCATGEWHEPETHLVPNVITAIIKGRPIKIFGTDYDTDDGTCVRDYIHVMDLVIAHKLVLDKMINDSSSYVYNLGIGKGYSVREIIDTVLDVTGKEAEVIEEKRRKGDPPVLVADSTKANKELNWTPKYSDIKTVVETAYKWHKKIENF